MSPTLKQEIKQTRPFSSLQVEAFLNLIRTATIFQQQMTALLKPQGLTPSQYNVLRILRGAGESGLCRYEVIDRLVAPDPDVTRLLDRLEKAGHVTRSRDEINRRLVKARITASGRKMLDSLESPLSDLHTQQFGAIDDDSLRRLIDILTSARLGGSVTN